MGIFDEPLKPALLAALRAQLAEGERLAWAASPERAAFQSKSRLPGKLDALAILGGGYATIAAGVMAVRTGRWLWLSVPIALIVAGTAAYLVARWFRERARKSVEGTIYGLTTRRALIVRTFPGLEVSGSEIASITDISLREKREDFADLVLESASSAQGMVFRAVSEPERSRAQLLRVIRDPEAVDREIAGAEAYAKEMQKLIQRTRPG